jgi:hypothetical protein
VHNIANQNPAGEAPRRQEYPPQGRGNGTRGRGRGRAQQPCRFYCLFHDEDCVHPTRDCPETKATRDRMARAQPADNPRVVAHTYQQPPQPYNHGPAPHPHPTPATAKRPPPQPPPSPKARRLHRSAVSRSHSHDHWGVQRRLRHKAAEEGPLTQHQPRRRHRSSRADEVVPCAIDLRCPRRRSA